MKNLPKYQKLLEHLESVSEDLKNRFPDISFLTDKTGKEKECELKYRILTDAYFSSIYTHHWANKKQIFNFVKEKLSLQTLHDDFNENKIDLENYIDKYDEVCEEIYKNFCEYSKRKPDDVIEIKEKIIYSILSHLLIREIINFYHQIFSITNEIFLQLKELKLSNTDNANVEGEKSYLLDYIKDVDEKTPIPIIIIDRLEIIFKACRFCTKQLNLFQIDVLKKNESNSLIDKENYFICFYYEKSDNIFLPISSNGSSKIKDSTSIDFVEYKYHTSLVRFTRNDLLFEIALPMTFKYELEIIEKDRKYTERSVALGIKENPFNYYENIYPILELPDRLIKSVTLLFLLGPKDVNPFAYFYMNSDKNNVLKLGNNFFKKYWSYSKFILKCIDNRTEKNKFKKMIISYLKIVSRNNNCLHFDEKDFDENDLPRSWKRFRDKDRKTIT